MATDAVAAHMKFTFLGLFASASLFTSDIVQPAPRLPPACELDGVLRKISWTKLLTFFKKVWNCWAGKIRKMRRKKL
jgi:hypothetical protein